MVISDHWNARSDELVLEREGRGRARARRGGACLGAYPALLATERRAFSDERWHWPELEGVEPLDLELTAMSPDEAQRAFLARYEELDSRRAK